MSVPVHEPIPDLPALLDDLLVQASVLSSEGADAAVEN